MNELLTIAALAPAQTACCGGCEFYVVAAKRKSLAILPWQSGIRWRVPAGLPVVHVKCSPVRLCHRHSAVRRARCSGRERPEWWCELHRQTVSQRAVDLQVDILRIEWAMRIITSPDSCLQRRAGLFSFSPVSCAGSFDELPRPGGSAQAGSANNAA